MSCSRLVVVSVLMATAVHFLGCECGGGSEDGGAGADAGAACRDISSVPLASTVERDTTIPAGCWLVAETIYVSNAAKLTVAPGATLKFALRTGIEVNSDGTLAAAGTADNPILFTGQQTTRGFWNGVTWTNSANPQNSLAWVTVEYAGAKEMLDAGAVAFRASVMLDSTGYEVMASLSHCTIRESLGYGLYLDDTATLLDCTGNTITENATGAVLVYAAAVHNLAAASTYTGNDVDLVHVKADYGFGTQDRTWAALGVPYRMEGSLILYHQLTLAAGTTVQFTHGSGIDIMNFNAALVAIGTASTPITFTGVDATPGFWAGLYFLNTNDTGSTTARSQLHHCVLEYGGGEQHLDSFANPFSGNVMLDGSGYNIAVDVADSVIRNSAGYGIWLDCLAYLTGSGNTFVSNPSGDIGQEPDCG